MYGGILFAAVALMELGAKVHKGLRLSGGSASGSELLAVVAGDLLFVASWSVLWLAALQIATGWRKTAVAAALQVSTFAILVFLVVEHAFFLVTGALLDWDLLVYTAAHLSRLTKVIASEVGAGSWAALVVVAFAGAAPWLFRPTGASDERALSTPTPRIYSGFAAMLLLLAGLQLLLGDGKISAQLQPIRTNTVVEHATDAFRQIVANDESRAALASRPVEPLLVVRGPKTKRHNVVVVVLESVRAQALGVYDDKLTTTPFLKTLAKRGLTANHAYTVVPHTTKSLIPVHCGLYPKITPYFDEASEGAMPSDCLAKVLDRQGYRTHYIQSPESIFERRSDLVSAFGFKKLSAKEQLPSKGFEKVGYFGYEDDVMLKPALDWVAEKSDKPFYLAMLTATSHHPYQVPKKFGKKDWGQSKKLNAYYDSISYTDRFLKQLFAGFEKQGLLGSTIFVLVGDHGEAFGEHGRFQHDQTLYEEGLRVPLMVIGPGVPKGKLKGGLWQHIDIVPTVLDALGLDVAAGELPGKSLLSTEGHSRLYFSCWRKETCQAIRTPTRKIIHYFKKRDPESFDLTKDPGEKRDLVAAGEIEAASLHGDIEEMKSWAEGINARYKGQERRRRYPFITKSRPADVGTPADVVFDGWARLIGYSIENPKIRDDQAAWVTTVYEVVGKAPKNSSLWMHAAGPKIRGKSKRVVADHVPVAGSYPISEWQKGDFIVDKHWLRMKPGHPSGKYEITFGIWDSKRKRRAVPKGTGAELTPTRGVFIGSLQVINRQTGKVTQRDPLRHLSKAERTRVERPASKETLAKPALARFGKHIVLREVTRNSRGWNATFTMDKDMPRWSDAFVHLVGPLPDGVTTTDSGRVVVHGKPDFSEMKRKGKRKFKNVAVRPFGRGLPFHTWRAGWAVTISLGVSAQRSWPQGRYGIWLGFWDPNLPKPHQRFPIVSKQPIDADRVLVGMFDVSPGNQPTR
ncbi:MAG: sulfatase-like hydrolase/transferase [Myxococcales bacterium]|nr:sulfatase-like hydrolase/transferase [Myxococcales bacterium]